MPDLPPLPPPGASAAPQLPPPPPPSAASGSDVRQRIVVWVAVAVVLVLIGAAAGLAIAGDGTEPADDEPPGDGVAAGCEDISVDPDVEAAVVELSDFVAAQRGAPFEDPVTVELASDEEFEARLLEDFEEGEEDLAETERIFRALGFIDDDADLVKALRDLLSVGVIGFYDPETDELVVRGDGVTPYTKVTIVHELVHAWDDQHFELDRPELDDADDESGFGFSALVEGNARRVENTYRLSLSSAETDAVDCEEAAYGASVDIDMTSIPLVLIELLVAPYELGEPFVGLLDDAGGEERINEAFDDPPLTSSAVIHPERYLNGLEATDVDPPPAPDGVEVFDEGVFGELVLAMLLRDEIGQGDALRAADNWAGDWYISWDEGDRTCLRVDVATFGDDASEEELRDAIETWADAQDDASVRNVGDLVRLTVCG